ncbi:MAG: HlyD family efflux transporter periplasmic adaptor subunit [Rugosibacter sp.]
MTTENTNKEANSSKRRRVLIGTTLAFVIVIALYSVYYLLVLTQREETDNAYVGGNLVVLTSQIAGSVREIHADETQLVEAGAEIVKLDTVDSEVALSKAEAQLGATVRQLREQYASVGQYEALVQQRKLGLQKAEEDLARRAPLAADHTLSAEEVTHARQAVADARAALDIASKQEMAARARLAGVDLRQHPDVLAAREAWVQAWVTLRRTSIRAPVAGYIAKRSAQVGIHVEPGTPLLSIVPLNQLWVDANFKEAELRNIRIGQPATIEADIYGGKVEYHGKVAGLSAGTGSAFSLLPAQNATGNWVKVVQRLPVRITLDAQELAKHPLRIGLSTLVTVDTHQRDGNMLGTPMPAAPAYASQAPVHPVAQGEALADKIIARNLVE